MIDPKTGVPPGKSAATTTAMNLNHLPADQQLRFARKKPVSSKVLPIPAVRATLLLKDQNHSKQQQLQLWIPTFQTSLRFILLARFFSGMYSIISDCDEVFNYWEPLHFLVGGKESFQTWEYAPQYGLRSYAYLLLHTLPSFVAKRFIPWDKRPAFFLLRLSFATVSSICESFMVHSATQNISPRVGRYLFFALLTSSGLYAASTAFLPSTFAMWCVMLSTAASLYPVDDALLRIVAATMGIAVAAIVGWPFTALMGVPLALEQLLLRGTVVKGAAKSWWRLKRCGNMMLAGALSLVLVIPLTLIDSHAYGKFSLVPLNLIIYNLFPSSPTSGPTLYGTEPFSYYLSNLTLHFNLLFPLALLSLPLLCLSSFLDPKRFGDQRDRAAGSTSGEVAMAVRFAPMYLWLAVVSAQPHKEERFLFPAYGPLLLNAAVSIFLLRGLAQVAFLRKTKSPWRASQTSLFSILSRILLIVTSLISLSRITSVRVNYQAPLTVYAHFQALELPRLALRSFPLHYNLTIDFSSTTNDDRGFLQAVEKRGIEIDLAPLQALNKGDGVRLCVGKEWHRFPGHFLLPDPVQLRWIRSAFEGILPKIWLPEEEGSGLWGRGTDLVPDGMNDQNRMEMDRFVNLSTCDYLIDLDNPHRSSSSYPHPLEPRYAVQSDQWQRVFCYPFLDAAESKIWSRVLFLPGSWWQKGNSWGDYCLLRNLSKDLSVE